MSKECLFSPSCVIDVVLPRLSNGQRRLHKPVAEDAIDMHNARIVMVRRSAVNANVNHINHINHINTLKCV